MENSRDLKMTVITASMVKTLRERTGAGIMICKHVLNETHGDMEAAIKNLRKRGKASSEKKSSRIASEGVILNASNHSLGLLIEVNSETDFVSKDRSFMDFSKSVAQVALNEKITNVDDLLSANLGKNSVEVARNELVNKVGENISIRRIKTMFSTGERLSFYMHGVRIGVLVKLNGGDHALGRDIAMHIAANRPRFISEKDISAKILENERQIFIAQAKNSQKSSNIIEKIVNGKIKKFVTENTLLGQAFVKNLDQTVGELLNQSKVKILNMIRFEVGESLEQD